MFEKVLKTPMRYIRHVQNQPTEGVPKGALSGRNQFLATECPLK